MKICDYFMKKLGLMRVTTTMATPGQYMHQWYMEADEALFGKPCKDIAIEDARFMGNTKAKLGHCVSVRGTIECPHCGGRIAVEIEESIKNPGEQEEESGEKDK